MPATEPWCDLVTEPLRSAPQLLFVDRDGDLAATVRALLRGRRTEISALQLIANAPEALAMIEQRLHDVCLVSQVFDRDGSIVAAAVAAGYAPVVFLSGHRDTEREQATLAAGAADGLWIEELSAIALDNALRHAIELRDRARLERQLHLAQRMETVGQLAGGIAHEFNNILTAIIGFGTLLAERVSTDEAASSQVREILSGAERASTLTRDLLAFSRRQVLRPEPVDLGELVPNLARMLKGVMGSSIELRVRCGERLPCILADRSQLEQAITNLAINARDAMPGGGQLIIELDEVILDEAYCETHVSAKPGPHLRLTITDTGVGIAPELVPRVFEPFFSTRSAAVASGLGLSTVYGIVKQSGGNIWVYSEQGLGTTFKLYFPVEGPAAVPVVEVVPDRREPVRGSETILLVDDTDIVRRLARDVLSTAGYRVLEAGGADEAIQVAGNQPDVIDLLVTDVVMPGRNGIELADRLRTTRSELPVLYISGYTDMSIVRDGLLSQDVAFLQKPFTPEELLKKVRQVLELY
jgi:two-component system, cell cycle sensor histidine kinase and response regulator CckA